MSLLTNPRAQAADPGRPEHAWRCIEVRPVAGALGAEIHGVDLSGSLAAEVVAEIRQAFLDYLVIFFHD